MNRKSFWRSAAALALALTTAVSVGASANTRTIAEDAALTVSQGVAVSEQPQVAYAIEADANKYEFVIGGAVGDKALVQNTAALRDGADVVAAVNGDHFSFKTGIPLGMSISDGEIITNPIPAYNDEEYFFHALGITADGEVLTGENPTLYMQYTVGEHTGTIDRINRTRENWEGGQISLFTPRYGDRTDTNASGVDVIIRVDEGAVRVGTMKGTIVEIDEDGDAPIEPGHVVLSISWIRFEEVEMLHVGDELEFVFLFEQEEWNDVVFAVGGNRTAVANGEVQEFDYTVGAFTNAAPRTAIGVKKDGTLVLAAVDGRSEISKGLTANEMAMYMAQELECEHALLLDGGGSTAMTVKGDDGAQMTVNVPSEERPIGNTVMLVRKESTSVDMTWVVCGALIAIIAAALVALLVVLFRGKNGKND